MYSDKMISIIIWILFSELVNFMQKGSSCIFYGFIGIILGFILLKICF